MLLCFDQQDTGLCAEDRLGHTYTAFAILGYTDYIIENADSDSQ